MSNILNLVDEQTFINQTNDIASAINTDQPIYFNDYGTMYQASMNIEAKSGLVDYAYAYCGKLESVNLNISYDEDVERHTDSENAFLNCLALKTAKIIGYTFVGVGEFRGCTALESVELEPSTEETILIENNAFNGCTALTSLVLNQSTVVEVFNVNAFANTPFRNGTGGTIYVPQELVSAYEADSFWGSLESVTFAAIEEMNND